MIKKVLTFTYTVDREMDSTVTKESVRDDIARQLGDIYFKYPHFIRILFITQGSLIIQG